MPIDIKEYYSPEEWKLFRDEAARHETPFLLVNLDIIRRKYNELRRLMPFAKVYYAVKSSPSVQVIGALAELGSNFDIASRYELDRVLSLGISPDRIYVAYSEHDKWGWNGSNF